MERKISETVMIQRVAKQLDRNEDSVVEVYDALINTLHDYVRNGYKVRMKGLGTVSVVTRHGHAVPNRNGGSFRMDDYETVLIKPSRDLVSEVR